VHGFGWRSDNLFNHAVPGTALWAAPHGAGSRPPALLANVLGMSLWHRRDYTFAEEKD
jgi:hypothetical protein